MTYNISVTNGSPIAIATGVSDTSTSLTLVGKNVPNYGQLIAQDLVNLMQNFAGTTQPNGVVTGQLWYDTTANTLKSYNGSTFDRIANIIVGVPTPTGHNPGDLWWDTTNVQLKVYSGSTWVVIGPAVAATSPIVYDTISDNTNTAHQVARIVVDGVNVAVLSSQTFTAKTTYAGLTNIVTGMTIVAGQFVGGLSGNATSATTAGSATSATSATTASAATYVTNLSAANVQAVIGSVSTASFPILNQNTTGTANTATTAKYADLAEYYTSDADYAPGTVVMIGGDAEVTAANLVGTTMVMGVVSTNPAYLMNDNCDSPRVAVALVGRVPCKVMGNIRRGDLLTASDIPGVAISIASPTPGSIIGKALENYNSVEVGNIEIIVGKH